MRSIRTIQKQKYRIPFVTPVLLVGILSMSCSTWVNSDWGDCGYSAYYSREKNGDKAEVVFSEVTAETVGGHRNCGFQYIKTKVDRAEIDGITLPERAEADEFGRNTYYYAVPAGFDPRTTVITITTRGKKYRSDLASVMESNKTSNVRLKAVWW